MKNLLLWASLFFLAHGSSGDPLPLPLLDPYAPPSNATPAVQQDFGEVVNVAITSIRARFVDPTGAPLRGIEAKDLAVRVAGQDVPILGVDWFDNAISPDDKPDPTLRPATAYSSYTRHRVSTLGQLFVFFVQSGPRPEDRGDARTLRRALPAVRKLVDRLKPEDLAAVVSYDDRLRLQLDFTLDHQAVADAIERAARTRELPEVRPAKGPVTLAPIFAAAAMGQPVGPEMALERTARTLFRLPGEKVMIYLGFEARPFAEAPDQILSTPNRLGLDYGSATRRRLAPSEVAPELLHAIVALQEACASVFVLDNSGSFNDRYHEILESLATSTGGTYARLRGASDRSVEQLARTLAGYYVITLNPEELHAEKKWQKVELSLKGRKKAQVLATPLWVATKPF